MNILISLIIGGTLAGIVGWLAGVTSRGYGYGIFANTVIGIAGGIAGLIIFSFSGLSNIYFISSTIISILGAFTMLTFANYFKTT